jgi:CBS domain-containing protein
MRRALFLAAVGAVLGHLPAAVLAAGSEDTIALVGHKAPLIIFVAFVIIVGVAVYFMRSRDQRAAPLARVFAAGRTIHSAGPDTTVAECARKMAAAKIGALVVMDN